MKKKPRLNIYIFFLGFGGGSGSGFGDAANAGGASGDLSQAIPGKGSSKKSYFLVVG